MSNTSFKAELKDVLSSFDGYKKGSKKYKQYANQGQKDEIKFIVDQIEEMLNTKTSSPILLLNSIRVKLFMNSTKIIKDCMDTKNELLVESFYQSKILQKMHVIASFEAGNENEDRGEQYFGQEVEEEVSVIGNSLLRLVLECFMFWPIMFETDKAAKNNMISKFFDDLNQKGVQFPQNINYFKSLYKQLSQESQYTNQTQSSNSNKQTTQEANKQLTSEENKNAERKDTSPTKKKKKKELNIKALEEKIGEENKKMKMHIQSIGKLLLVPTYSQLNKQSVQDAIEELKISQELANTIFQVLKDVQDCINVDLLTQYIMLNEKNDELLADYQLLISSNMKFDDFSEKYGITPPTTNEIKLIQEQDQQRKLSDKIQNQNQKQDNVNQQQQQQELLVVEELEFEGDSPAYKQNEQQTNQNQKILSQFQKQSNQVQPQKQQDISKQNNDKQNKQDIQNIQNNQMKQQNMHLPQQQLQKKSSQENNKNQQNDNYNAERNDNKNVQINDKTKPQQNDQFQQKDKNIQNNNFQNDKVESQKNINTQQQIKNNQNQQQQNNQQQVVQNQQKNQVPPNSIDNRSINQVIHKKKTTEDDEDYEYEEYDYDEEDQKEESQSQQQMKQQSANQKQNQGINQRQENDEKYMKKKDQNMNRQQQQDQNIDRQQQQQNINRQQQQQKSEQNINRQQQQEYKENNNILKDKQNEQQNKVKHSIYHEDDIKQVQSLNSEHSLINNDSIVIESKQKKQSKEQLQSYHSQQSNSLQGSQYDQRGRSSSFKSLFEDPVHIQIMQLNSKRGSIPRAPSNRDDQNTSIDNKQNSVISQEKKEIQNLKEKISFYIQKLNEKEQLTKNMDQEIQMLNAKLQNFEKIQSNIKSDDQSKNREINEMKYQLQLMNDELQARDSVLEQNQKQFTSLQKKYDEINYNYQELQIRCGEQENDIEEKNEELKYLKLQDQHNTENLLEDERIHELTIELDEYKELLNQKEQDINYHLQSQKQQQQNYDLYINQLKETNQSLENQISVFNQEIEVLRSKTHTYQNHEKAETIQGQFERSQETIRSQEQILKQKENAIQDLIFKNGQLKENQMQLEQELQEQKTQYQKSLKQITEQKEQAKKELIPLKQENTEMFELLNNANMEIQKLKQRINELEGEQNQYSQPKSSTREYLDKISMENIRVSYELKQQKEHLGQHQQQIKDLTTIIQNLKTDNLMMSEQLKTGRSLMNQSNEKFFIYMTESDKNSSQKFGNIQIRSNAPLAEKVIKNIHNYAGVDKQLKKNDHQETFGYNQLQVINLGSQNTETQEILTLIENQKEQEYQSEKSQNTNDIGQKMSKKPLVEQVTQIDKDQKQQDDQEMNKNDSQTNLISIKENDEQFNEQNQNKYILNQQDNKNKSSLSTNQIQKERQRILLNNLINEEQELKQIQKPISNKQISQEDNGIKKNILSNSQQNNIQQFYSHQVSTDDQNTPKAPKTRPSFVREIQSPKRRSVAKQSQPSSDSKSLGYMSFNQEEFERNKLQQIEYNNNIILQNCQVIEQVIEQTSTIQSGQNTIFYSNNNTIEQGDTQNFHSQRHEYLNTNPLKLTPTKDSANRQDRIEKLQSLSDYLKIQSKKNTFSPLSTGPQGIRIPYNQTADFDITINNESKLNSLMQDLHTFCKNETDKIKLEDYNDGNYDDEESCSNGTYEKDNLTLQSPQEIELIKYGEDDQTLSSNRNGINSISRNIQTEQQQNIILNQRTQIEDFQTKSSNYEETDSQIETKQQNQLFYKQIIYPHKPDEYYIQKSIETSKLHSGQTIPYEEDLFNNMKILSNENLSRFKKSCLQNKTLLFENDYIKVGLTNHNHVYSGKSFAKLQIYIFNKDPVNDIPYFNLRYLMNEDVTVWTKPENITGDIKINKHLKQDLIVDLNCIPFEFLTAHFQIETEGDDKLRTLNEYFLMLPISLNRFLSFSQINANIFKSKWLINQVNCINSEEFEFNAKIVKNSFIFLEYFPNTIELNPYRKEEHIAGLDEYKIGGVFQFYHLDTQQFLIKITVKPFNKLVIQISPSDGQNFNEDSSKCCLYLLQTLYFLFKYNPLENVNQD